MTDPNWTPQEPRRPLQPKPDGFSVAGGTPIESFEQAADSARADKLIQETQTPEEPNGSKE